MSAPRQLATRSTATRERDRLRFRGPVEQRAICERCHQPFVYRRHIGRPRSYCSAECAIAAKDAQRRLNET